MATKVVYTIREDKQGLNKQLGCMNGIFQLFDRRYLLGLHRQGRNQNRLTSGQDGNGENKNPSEKAKEKNTKKAQTEKNGASLESSRNSSSSSSSSATISSFGCSKRVQKEWQLPPEPTSPTFHSKKPNWPLQPPDIKTVVKDSMAREIRVQKVEKAGPVMKHVDSPRPSIHQKSLQDGRKERKIAKIQKPSLGVKDVKETSRLSCDERKSQFSLKSTFKVNELPRLSLDSKQNSNKNSMNESRSEPGSNKRPSSGVVARLMGLESLTDSIHEVETLKIKPVFDDQLVSSPRWSIKGEECSNHNPVSVSPRVHLKNTKSAPASVYGEMEKRLSALEFKTSGNDLRALKQILEAMQTNKRRLDNKKQSLDSQKTEQPGSPMINQTSSPKSRATKQHNIDTESMMIAGVHSFDHATRKQVKGSVPRSNKATRRTSRSLSLLNSSDDVTGERPAYSLRLQSSKNGVGNQYFLGPSSDLNRIKKQLNVQPSLSDLKTRHPKIKLPNPKQSNKQSCRYSNDADTISYKLGSYTNLASQIKPKVTRNDQPKEDPRFQVNFAERLMDDKPTVELAKLTVEQQSPVSVLDAFYTEETLSPVKKKPSFFNDHENLYYDESESTHVANDVLLNSTDTNQYSEFNQVTPENKNHLIHQIGLLNPIDETVASPCKSTNGDHRYVSEILSASGFLKDPDYAIRVGQLHPEKNLIKPELFNILEKTNDACLQSNPRSTFNTITRRKMIFDCVNDILLHKYVLSSGMWTRRRCGELVNGEKLLKELWSEIDNLRSTSERCLYDEDDEVKNLVSADVNKKLEDWDKGCCEVPGLVLDVERQIFKDLINEVVNAEVANLQDRPPRHCRRLFSM